VAPPGDLLGSVSVGGPSRAAVRSWMRAVLGAVEVPAAVVWPDGRMLHGNPAFADLLDRRGPGPRPELRGAFGPSWAEALRRCVARGRPAAWGGDGGPGGTLVPLCGRGRVLLVAFILRADAAEAGQDAQLEGFRRIAAGAAHEIRNPLTAISGLLQLLAPLVAGDPGAGYLRIVRDEVVRLERIATDLLLLGGPPREPAGGWRCDLAACLRGVVDLFRAEAAGRSVALAADVEPALLEVRADPGGVRQVLVNLVSNALDAARAGGSVQCAARAAGAFVEATVSDDGPGIPAEVLPRVFEPFFTTKAGGTGLGLAVSLGIVRRAGGRITVESAPGAGTLVRVRLPPCPG
jgi:signal transduction histidine kinase